MQAFRFPQISIVGKHSYVLMENGVDYIHSKECVRLPDFARPINPSMQIPRKETRPSSIAMYVSPYHLSYPPLQSLISSIRPHLSVLRKRNNIAQNTAHSCQIRAHKRRPHNIKRVYFPALHPAKSWYPVHPICVISTSPSRSVLDDKLGDRAALVVVAVA